MSLDGFLTFLGLLIAAYAVLDPVSRLKLLVDAPAQRILIALALMIILPFALDLSILDVPRKSVSVWLVDLGFDQPPDLLTNGQIAFLATLGWAFAAFLRLKYSRPSLGKLKRLLPVVENLHDEGRYLELLELIDPYRSKLTESGLRRGRRFKSYDQIEHASRLSPTAGNDLPKNGWKVFTGRCWLNVALHCVRPSCQKSTQNALKIVDILVKSKAVRRSLQTAKPKLAVDLFLGFYSTHYDWCDLYIAESMKNRDSHLRRDIARTDGYNMNGYCFSNESIFLSALVEDPEIAKSNGVWQPVGNAVTKAIKEDGSYQVRLHNAPPQDDADLFDDITYAGVHFFDILVRQAATQECMDNMYLMYLQYFIQDLEGLPKNTAPPSGFSSEGVDLKEMLIRKSLSTLEGWVDLARMLPDGNKHKAPNNAVEAKKVAAIPFWAAKTLGNTIRLIVLSSKLSDDFKASCLSGYVYTGARGVETGSYLRTLLADSLFTDFSTAINPEVVEEIKALRPRLDPANLFEFSEFTRQLQ